VSIHVGGEEGGECALCAPVPFRQLVLAVDMAFELRRHVHFAVRTRLVTGSVRQKVLFVCNISNWQWLLGTLGRILLARSDLFARYFFLDWPPCLLNLVLAQFLDFAFILNDAVAALDIGQFEGSFVIAEVHPNFTVLECYKAGTQRTLVPRRQLVSCVNVRLQLAESGELGLAIGAL